MIDAAFLTQFLVDLQKKKTLLEKQIGNYTGEAMPDGPPPWERRMRYEVDWREPSADNRARQAGAAKMSMTRAREFLREEIERYIEGETGDYMLLVRGEPGTGKSTAARFVLNDGAEKGHKFLYAMPRHDFYPHDVETCPSFKFDNAHHWLGTGTKGPNLASMCRFADEAREWTSRGYPLIKMCRSVCDQDGYRARCPYRRQAAVTKKIIYATHNHLSTGLSMDGFTAVVCDELPMGAFVGEARLIPVHAIDAGNGRGPFQELFSALERLALNREGSTRLDGLSLLEVVGPVLEKIYERVDLGNEFIPAQPDITDPSDVYRVPEWYIIDFLRLMLPEYVAWKSGLDNWLSRIYITSEGLHLLQKGKVWDNLPDKFIVLDATGNPWEYEQLFGRPVMMVEPLVERIGRVFQVGHKLFGQGTVLTPRGGDKGRSLTSQGHEMLDACRLIAGRRPPRQGEMPRAYRRCGFITFKSAYDAFAEAFGEDNVMWFGGNRGTNWFLEGPMPVDCVIVAGTPSPDDRTLVDIAAQMTLGGSNANDTRIEPFSQDFGGSTERLRTIKDVEFHYIDPKTGLAPFRPLSGFWDRGELEDVYTMFREAELLQSGYRARPGTQDADVWFLSTVPVPMWLDGFYATIAEAAGLPDGVHHKTFAALSAAAAQLRGGEWVSIGDFADSAGFTSEWTRKVLGNVSELLGVRVEPQPFASGRGRRPIGVIRNG